MILKDHHKELTIKAFTQFMTRTRGTEVLMIKEFKRVLPTYYDK